MTTSFERLSETDDTSDAIIRESSLDPFIDSSDDLHSRQRGEGASDIEALYHIVCVIAGSGLLQLPYALKLSGWAGIALMLISAWVNDFTGKLLVKCLYVSGIRVPGYPAIGYAAYGIAGQRCVELFYNSILLGVTCLYLILAGMNLELMAGIFSQKEWIIICAACVTVPLLLLRTLKEVAIVSLFGAIASCLVMIFVVYAGFVDYNNYVGKSEHSIINLDLLPAAFGTFSFSFGGNFVYPEVEGSMANPSAFPKVLSVAMAVITVMYLVTSVTAYGVYGDATLSPILLNLPKGGIQYTAQIVITAHVLLACPLLITTFSRDLERQYSIDKIVDTPEQKTKRCLLRVAVMTSISLIAIAIPYFSDLMMLLGAVANTMLIFIFPTIFYNKLYGFKGWQQHSIAAFIILVGVVGGSIGGFEALRALWLDISS